jgi:hypothetical protein
MAKKLNETIDDLRNKLLSNKSSDRRSSAKKIGQFHIKELESDLYKAYLKEIQDKRTWETQCEMITAMGILENKDILSYLVNIIEKNENHDSITLTAAIAYVRITRKQKNDASSVIELFKSGGLSVLNGAAYVLAYDGMVPDNEQTMKIIKIIENRENEINSFSSRGSMDPRRLILFSSLDWSEKDIINNFINRCLKIESIIKDKSFVESFKLGKNIYKTSSVTT